MVVKYEAIYKRMFKSGSGTPDVDRCVFQFGWRQVQAAIAERIAGPWARIDSVRGIQCRDQLVEFDIALSAAARAGEELFAIRVGEWPQWGFILARLKETRGFQTITCEICNRCYDSAAIRQETWEDQTVGGIKGLCPTGHILYSVGIWIS